MKFALWVGCASILMMFAAFSSAYIVRHAAGNWLEFELPNTFLYSTAIILLSSVTLHLSYIQFKKQGTPLYRGLLVATAILGFTFLGLQYQAWMDLKAMGVFLDGNPSGSFLYVLSGIHAAHVLGGAGVLMVALLHAFMLRHKVTGNRKLRFELTLTYWHFVGFLWIYLLVLFMTQ